MYDKNEVARILERNLRLNGVGERTIKTAVKILVELFVCRSEKSDMESAYARLADYRNRFGVNMRKKLISAQFIAEDAADDRLDERLLEHIYEIKSLI